MTSLESYLANWVVNNRKLSAREAAENYIKDFEAYMSELSKLPNQPTFHDAVREAVRYLKGEPV